jgi:hypothetical protein
MSKKKKIVKLIKCFRMGSFPPMIMFCIGFSGKEIMQHLKKQKAKDWLAGIKGEEDYIDRCKYVAMHREIISTETERPTKQLYYLIFTEPFMFTDDSYSILAHEVLHITQFALKDILDINNEIEAFAYTHTFVMNKCIELIRGKS